MSNKHLKSKEFKRCESNAIDKSEFVILSQYNLIAKLNQIIYNLQVLIEAYLQYNKARYTPTHN